MVTIYNKYNNHIYMYYTYATVYIFITNTVAYLLYMYIIYYIL